jgi:predicted oxidoreductase
MQPTRAAIGTWSGGRFMRFGEPLSDERMRALVRPGEGIDTVITADVYGEGEADRMLAGALKG